MDHQNLLPCHLPPSTVRQWPGFLLSRFAVSVSIPSTDAFLLSFRKANTSLVILPLSAHESRCLLTAPINPLRGPFGPSSVAGLLRPLLTSAPGQEGLHPLQSRRQISRGKFDRLPHATPEFTTSAFHGWASRSRARSPGAVCL
jgi:hypothetical protein